ncbi:hypothetical protein PCASD_26763 [Puccinia coronata f. sp. avenae]|uniref:Uncharacterized protein n=1 Tax=Puccinia coronata f. sp. avenae TaxID=200324 RepID=A0A2N5RVR3_9BASI|nr:hypothetical protein PCASD_26763 [Puccinia coronata f. sp. avenae]
MDGSSSLLSGPSNLLAGPSSLLAGPSNLLAGPSSLLAGPSSLLAGSSSLLAGSSSLLAGASRLLGLPGEQVTLQAELAQPASRYLLAEQVNPLAKQVPACQAGTALPACTAVPARREGHLLAKLVKLYLLDKQVTLLAELVQLHLLGYLLCQQCDLLAEKVQLYQLGPQGDLLAKQVQLHALGQQLTCLPSRYSCTRSARIYLLGKKVTLLAELVQPVPTRRVGHLAACTCSCEQVTLLAKLVQPVTLLANVELLWGE